MDHRGRSYRLRPEPARDVPSRRLVRRSHPPGCQGRRLAGGATDEVRATHQPQNGQGNRPHNPATAAPPGDRGDPVACSTNAANSCEQQGFAGLLQPSYDRSLWALLALLLAAVFTLSPLDGIAEEKQIVDVKELAGRWRGWVAEVAGDEWATMSVSADGSYKASATSTTTVGKFYLEAGKLRYRSGRTTPAAMPSAQVVGDARLSQAQDKTHI